MTTIAGARCAKPTRSGAPCGMPPLDGSRYCFAHHPARARQRAAARKKGGRDRRTPDTLAAGRVVRLRDVGSVQALLEETISTTLAQENSGQRSRTLGYLLGLALKALEVRELEERVAALEQRLPAESGARA